MTFALTDLRLTSVAVALPRWFRRAPQMPVTPAEPMSRRELAEVQRDCRLPAEDVLGTAPGAGAPFFLQPGFGRKGD
jgi:hypothetical protein